MTKRKLRSDTAAERKLRGATATDTAADGTILADPEPVTKRAKAGQPKFLCTCCDTERPGRFFPKFNPSSECEHLINTCKACLKQWIAVQVESSNFIRIDEEGGASTFGIKCVECKETMRPVNVEAAATKTVYEKFDRLARRHLAESIPNWRWCLAIGCEHGQEHVKEGAPVPLGTPKKGGRLSRKADTTQSEHAEVDICTCSKCGARACVACDVPMHEKETCEEYRGRTRSEENDASLQLIESTFKKCPKCSKSIEKNGGCDSMYCTQCHSAFCWTCRQVFQGGHYCHCNPRPQGPAAPAAAPGGGMFPFW
ncbi:putative IBR domain, E3 ubiquitin ligase RBR family, TRIAD supradomain-containing protein [Septoria linicola]|nr:putative IBR domain, E3 ubiquitin ligase RBR family, TRIAD supradomain-containing protein [Septoria linicola]